MKKRVKSILLLTVATLGVGAFATACGEVEEPHVHTYSEDWTSDAEGHFHQATCDDAEDEAKQAHVDNNNDGACDICTYTDHEHTYSEDWTVDCTNHWHAADCGHIVAGSEVAAHVDENNDGECDVCKYVIEDIHEHYFDSNWTSDDEYHWHAALCEHKDQISGKEAHNLNAAGDCTVCGEHIADVEMTNIADVIAAAQANDYKIIDGAVVAKEEVYGGTGKDVLENAKTEEVYFVLGNGESYINRKSFDKSGNFIGVEEQWHQKVTDEEYFGVVMKDAAENPLRELESMMSAAQFLNGYNYIPGSIVPGTDVDTSTLANMLGALYSQMKAGVHVSNATESYNKETGEYAFAYTYYSVNANKASEGSDNAGEWMVEVELYHAKAAFTVNADMIIDWAEFEVEVYRDYENDSDLTYTFNEETKDVEGLAKKATANPSFYTYSVAQHSGVRTFTSPYPRQSLIPTSFDLYHVKNHEFVTQVEWVIHEEELIGESLTIDEGTYAYFHLGNIKPITASTSFMTTSDFQFSFVNKDGSNGKAWYMTPGSVDESLNEYSAYINCLKLKLRDPGEYTVTIKFGNLTKTFDLTIADVDGVGDDDVGGGEDSNADYTAVITVDSGSVWFSAEEITAGTATRTLTIAQDGDYVITSDELNVASIVDANDNPIIANLGVYTLTAGDYKVTFSNFGNLALVANTEYTLSVEAYENEGGDSTAKDISGTYLAGNGQLVIDGETNTIVYTFKTYTFNYTYSIADNVVTLYQNGNPINATMAIYAGKLELDSDGNPTTWYYNGNGSSLTKVGGSEGGETPTEPTETTVTLVAGENNLTIAKNTYVSAVIYLNGTYVVTWTGDVNVEMVISSNIPLTNGDKIMCSTYGVYLKIYADDYAAADVTITLTADSGSEGGEGGDEGGDEPVDPNPGDTEETAGILEGDGYENQIEVTADDIAKGYVLYSFTPYEDGTYVFQSNDLGILAITDSEGNEATVEEYSSYTLESYTMYFVKVNTGWVSNAGTYTLTIEYQYPEGHEKNPIWISTGDNTANYAGNYAPAVWHSISASEDGVLTVSTSNTTATIMLKIDGGEAVSSENGTVSLKVIKGLTYRIGVLDEQAMETVEIPFTVAIEAGEYEGDGTVNMPVMMELGDIEAVVPEWGATYFAYRATANGMLVLATDNTNADLSVKIPFEEEPVTPTDGKIVVEMREGQVVILYVSTMDFSAATITVDASWKAAPTGVNEGVTVAVGENNLTIAENTYIDVNISNVEAADYTIAWNNENVLVEVDGVAVENGGTFNVWNAMMGTSVKIYGKNYAAVESFTLTITKVVVPATPVVLGDNTVTVTDTWNGTSVEFTATEAGDYTFTAGTNAVLGYDYSNYLNGEFFTVTLAEGESVQFVVLTEDYAAGDVVVTIAKAVAGGDEEPEQPATPNGTQANPYIVDALPYELKVEGSYDVYIKFVATEDCTIAIKRTGGSLDGVPGGFENDLATKTRTGTVTAGQEFTLNYYGSGEQTLTISVVTPVEPEPENPEQGEGTEEPTLEGAGTQSNPYVIASLATALSHTEQGKHDIYLTYTAEKDGILVIKYVDGITVDIKPGGFDRNMAEFYYSGAVTQGTTYTFNVFTFRTADVAYTVTWELQDPVVDEGGEDAGESADDVLTYLGTRGDGRATKVLIYLTEGKIEYYQANSSGSFENVVPSVFEYTEGMTSANSISGNYASIVLENGVPVSVTCFGQVASNFVLQA